MNLVAEPKKVVRRLEIHAIPLAELPEGDNIPFLQWGFWGRHKAAFGWHPHAFRLVLSHGGADTHLLVLSRNLVGRFRFAYVPHGPAREFVEHCSSALGLPEGVVISTIAGLLKPLVGQFLVFIRWDLAWVIARRPAILKGEAETDESASPPVSVRRNLVLNPLVRAGADVQPPDTVIIDLTPGADAVLAAMKSKTRYNVRLAEKKGVRVEVASLDALPAWYAIYRETALRDQIALHSEAYYRTLLEENPGRLELLLAWHEQDLLAGNIMLYAGKQATYLYGASSNLKRNLMSTYLLQWVGLRRAIDRGCRSYDCFGVPPSDDPQHPMHGLYQFKTGLGGDVVSFPGCWDSPTMPLLYWLYGLAEKARYFYFKKLRKR